VATVYARQTGTNFMYKSYLRMKINSSCLWFFYF